LFNVDEQLIADKAQSDGKIMFVIKITDNLDPNLKSFLNSIKTALLMRTVNLRLVIIEGDKVIAG